MKVKPIKPKHKMLIYFGELSLQIELDAFYKQHIALTWRYLFGNDHWTFVNLLDDYNFTDTCNYYNEYDYGYDIYYVWNKEMDATKEALLHKFIQTHGIHDEIIELNEIK
jgi:hypothetical protein